MVQKQVQQGPLARREVDGLVVGADTLACDIDVQATDHALRSGRHDASLQRADSRFELADRKRLGEVILGAEVESVHAVLDRIAGGQHQNQRRRMSAAQSPQYFESVDIRKANVEDHEVKHPVPEQLIGVLAGGCMVYGVTGATQHLDQAFSEEGVVFDYEYAHTESPEWVVVTQRIACPAESPSRSIGKCYAFILSESCRTCSGHALAGTFRARGIIPSMSTRRSRSAGSMAYRVRAAIMGFIGFALLIAVATIARAQPAYDAAFVSQTAPSFVAIGALASVSVTMQNTGTATWYLAQGDVFLATT